MSVEVVSYRLTYRGRPAGTQVLKTEVTGTVRRMEARAAFQGLLGNATVVQRSRSSAQHHHSLRFSEETQEREGRRVFDVEFDAASGLVRATTGPKDVATAPYIRPYRDPLSLLGQVRALAGESAHGVAMLGKDVTVLLAGEVELATALGDRRAWAYVVHPGGSIVYVDMEAPHTILKLTQRLPDGHLDSLIVSVATEPTLDGFGDEGGKRGQQQRRRGRRRPRRRRRG
ncbi:MAG TPA: DUF3108 domain-containing protein [Trueperaceae bacterium]|jgi:hypothetical protein